MDEQATSAETSGKSSGRRTILRLLSSFLPHAHVFVAAMAMTFLYTGLMTARVALIYPAMRVFVQNMSEEEIEQFGGKQVKHLLTDDDSQFSGTLEVVNKALDGIELAVIDLFSFAIPEEIENDPIKKAQIATLLMVIILFMLVTILSAATHLAEHTLKQLVVLRVLVSLRVRLLENLLFQPLAFHNDKERGELISRMSADVNAALACLNYMLVDLTRQGMLIVWPVLLVSLIKPWLMLIVAVFIPAFMISLQRQTKRIRERAKVRQHRTAKVTEAMVQLFSGIRVVKAFALEKEKVENYSAANREFARDAMATEIAKAWTRTRMEFLTNSIIIVGLVVALFLFGAGGDGIPAGALFGFVFLMAQMHRPVKRFTRVYTELGDSLAGAERMYEFMDLKPSMQDRRGAIELNEVVGGVRFDDVSFGYNGGDRVLKHINLEIPAGQIVALVGPSGAGKTTLANLVPRFYDPDDGRITIDGTDIREFTQNSLRRGISVVTQDPFLFNTSIRENIGHGRPGASEKEIIAAAKAANIHDHIIGMDGGYDSVVGERGVKLSGGQCQRLTIARAILRDARILILDEATSSLDTESERAVQAALSNLMEGRTTLVIAHRLSTVRHADKICVLEDGAIVDMGSHDELMTRDSLYHRLYDLQFVSVVTKRPPS